MDLRSRLLVLHDDGGVFTDHSADAQDFKRDVFGLELTSDDFIYVGYNKNINALYIDLATPNTIPASLVLEYYTTQNVWSALAISDDTKGMTRSGFITWARPEDAQAVSVNSIESCWVRISSSANTDVMSVQAINILFSDDNDICQEVPALIDACFYQNGQASHILNHVAAKNYIMGRLRSLKYIKTTANGDENINEWDILDIFELRQASTYYAISQIYFNLSDNVDDQYWAKYQEYNKKFEEAFGLGQLRIDTNDDGLVNETEKRPIASVRWER